MHEGPTPLLSELAPRPALVQVARDFHRRGWMAGTAGNLSVRDPAAPDSFWITASGRPKGSLREEDFLRIRVGDGAVLEHAPDRKPSAESSIHRVLYAAFAQAGACLHVHTVDACMAAERAGPRADTLRLPPLEMVKGLGIWEQDPSVDLPLFDNWLEVDRIADEIGQRFGKAPPAVPALMIRGHGITAWGADLQQAYNHIEIAEFLMSYLARHG